MLQRQARRYGGQPLFAAGDVSFDFEEAPGVAARFAGTLAAAGIRPGDRVALMCSQPRRIHRKLSRLRLARRDRGADQYRLARTAARSIILSNSGARLMIIEADLARRARPCRSEMGLHWSGIWLIGGSASAAFDRSP